MNSNTPIRSTMGPLMAFNTLIRMSVGADLSRPSPMYRPSVDVPKLIGI